MISNIIIKELASRYVVDAIKAQTEILRHDIAKKEDELKNAQHLDSAKVLLRYPENGNQWADIKTMKMVYDWAFDNKLEPDRFTPYQLLCGYNQQHDELKREIDRINDVIRKIEGRCAKYHPFVSTDERERVLDRMILKNELTEDEIHGAVRGICKDVVKDFLLIGGDYQSAGLYYCDDYSGRYPITDKYISAPTAMDALSGAVIAEVKLLRKFAE